MRKLFENIEKKIFIPAFLVLIVLTLTIYLFPGQVSGVISILFSLCSHELGLRCCLQRGLEQVL